MVAFANSYIHTIVIYDEVGKIGKVRYAASLLQTDGTREPELNMEPTYVDTSVTFLLDIYNTILCVQKMIMAHYFYISKIEMVLYIDQD